MLRSIYGFRRGIVRKLTVMKELAGYFSLHMIESSLRCIKLFIFQED